MLRLPVILAITAIATTAAGPAAGTDLSAAGDTGNSGAVPSVPSADGRVPANTGPENPFALEPAAPRFVRADRAGRKSPSAGSDRPSPGDPEVARARSISGDGDGAGDPRPFSAPTMTGSDAGSGPIDAMRVDAFGTMGPGSVPAGRPPPSNPDRTEDRQGFPELASLLEEKASSLAEIARIQEELINFARRDPPAAFAMRPPMAICRLVLPAPWCLRLDATFRPDPE